MDTKPLLTKDRLMTAGFRVAGSWELDDTASLRALGALPTKSGVYAFVVQGVARYVGLASGSMKARLNFYRRPGPSQSTNIRLNRAICDHLSSQGQVDVMIAHPPDFQWSGLRVSGAEGLEAALIADFDLPWNKRGSSNSAPIGAGSSTMMAGNAQSKVLEQIRKRGGMTELDIAKAVYGRSATQQRVNPHCRALVQAGQVERKGSGGPGDPFVYFARR